MKEAERQIARQYATSRIKRERGRNNGQIRELAGVHFGTVVTEILICSQIPYSLVQLLTNMNAFHFKIH